MFSYEKYGINTNEIYFICDIRLFEKNVKNLLLCFKEKDITLIKKKGQF